MKMVTKEISKANIKEFEWAMDDFLKFKREEDIVSINYSAKEATSQRLLCIKRSYSFKMSILRGAFSFPPYDRM
ncbi:hypothetical protein [Paenibacillus polymyxa]|uniref:hypothetical protein n=1 Tax=Paenibacillus TaxID=44249 RepID=UPI002023F85B|nr:hypothetical protein [Paenibacillus polymyxa]URJ40760.1 hypothetical protein MF627_000256 [Paenibacillus polymyxa]